MTVDEAAVYIRNNVDIVEVVSRYVSLKKVGRNYFGLCPFHSEKTPSFSVNPGKGIFKCFGCGEGGDVIKFLSKIENVSYREAVKMLATEVGISVDENSETEKILQVLEEARRLMNGVLLTRSGALALRYLSSRGVKAETIGVFGLGYDPTRDFLQKALIRKGFTADLVRKAGLTNSIGNDFFGRRIVFPIENLSRRTIGFGARTLDETNPVKYLNTGETATFKKSRVLYGINQALPSIDKTKSVILVEGYFDAVVLSQEGFSNVVAILGTTVTPEQSRLLSRKVRRLWINIASIRRLNRVIKIGAIFSFTMRSPFSCQLSFIIKSFFTIKMWKFIASLLFLSCNKVFIVFYIKKYILMDVCYKQ